MKLSIFILILSSVSLFVDAGTCAKQFGAFTNTNGCSCGTATCDASTGFYCVTSRNLCAMASVPPGVTLSGSSKQPGLMGKYVWLGSYTNFKPAYKFSNYYLYWESTNKVWVISISLGSLSVKIYWTNDVLRPEFSPSLTAIKASSTDAWKDDTMVIVRTCPVPTGIYSNENKCSCGTATCDASTGYFCIAASNKCATIAACTINDGSTVNSNPCTCGSNDCSSDNGQFCLASSNKCDTEKIVACTSNVGLSLNDNDCWCGTSECTASTGRYCVSSINICTANFVPGDVILSGSTIQPSLMGKYRWLGPTLTNGKSAYKFHIYYLYWLPNDKEWVIGSVSLGSLYADIYWTNDVLRPEFSPSPTAIKASANGWKGKI